MPKKSQVDKFLIEIQKPKMTELWDNKEDEIWDRIPIEKLSAKELKEHKRDLEQAQKEYREGKTKSIDEL